MKIKLVTTYPPTRCGVAEHSERLINSLKKVGIKPEIVDIKKPHSMNPFYFIGLAKEAAKDTSKNDIIHVQFHLSLFGRLFGIFPGFYITVFLMWLRLFSKAKVVIVMFDSSTKSSAKSLGIRGVIFFYYYRMLAPFLKYFSYRMIFHSEYGEKIALKEWKFNKDKIDIIPFGIPSNMQKLNKKMCKNKLGYPNKKILLVLGYIKEGRNYEMILESLKRLDENVVLLIAGEVQLKKHQIIYHNILKKVQELKLNKRVKMLGYVEEKDMPVLLNAIDIGIIPYKKEFGDWYSATLSTQLAYNIPILATNLDTFENLKKQKKCIETYDRNNLTDLTEKIKSLLYNKSKINNLKTHSKRYLKEANWDSVGKKTKNFYLSLFK